MPETLQKKNTLGLYWPTIAAAFAAVAVGVVVSRLQGSLIFAGASTLVMLLAFGGVYWRERSVRSHILETSHPIPSALSPGSITKPEHNVQCTGFKVFTDEDFITATLSFQNVPNGKLLGKFRMPRLRVVYYNLSTGEEIADMCPTTWRNEEGTAPVDIGAQEQYAVIASFFKKDKTWKALELLSDDDWLVLKLNSVRLPVRELHIIASLSAHPLRIPPVEGILTLGEDGSASFKPTKGFIQAI